MGEATTKPSVVDRVRVARARVKAAPGGTRAWRLAVGLIGSIVLAVGIVCIPYPGPGWLIVFAGLGLLATEFDWAHRLLKFARIRYDRFAAWLGEQSILLQAAFGLLTCAVVLATLWVFGAAAMLAGWVGIDWAWLASPLFG